MTIKSEKIKKFLKYSIPAKIFIIAFFVFFVFQLVIHVYPFLFVINNSLKTAEEIYKDSMAFTTTWSFRNYLVMIQKFPICHMQVSAS
jgi:ABC-type glycerol-3-phosphate transport system permease component